MKKQIKALTKAAKKTRCGVLAFILAVCMLSGCVQNVGTQSSGQSAQESLPSSSAGAQSSCASQTQSGIPADAQKTGVAGLYRFGTQTLTAGTEQVQAQYRDGVLRVEYITAGMDSFSLQVVLYDPAKNLLLGSVSLGDGLWETGCLDGGGFYAITLADPVVQLYDTTGNRTDSFAATQGGDLWNSAALSSDGNYLLYNRLSDGALLLYCRRDASTVQVGNICNAFTMTDYADGIFYISASDGTGAYAVDTETAGIEKISPDDCLRFIGVQSAVGSTDSYFLYAALQPQAPLYAVDRQQQEEAVSASADGKFVTSVWGADSSLLRVYDVENKVLYPAFTIVGTLQCVTFCEGDWLLIVAREVGVNASTFYCFDLSQQNDVQTLQVQTADESFLTEGFTPAWTGTQDMQDLAAKLLADYGVSVVYDAADMDLGMLGYECDTSLPEDVYAKMQATQTLLQSFPQGMLQQAGKGSEILLFLCQGLHISGQEGGVAGLTSQMYGHISVVMDISGYDFVYTETLAHELCHVFDYSFTDTWLQGWEELLPEQIRQTAYVNSYYTGIENTYTPFDNGATPVWFYDVYAKTFPQEDRAVLFQKMCAMALTGESDAVFTQNPNLQKKARYLCTMLRAAFSQADFTQAPFWETAFAPLDSSEFASVFNA